MATAAYDYDEGEMEMRPPDAAELSGKQLAEEMERRGLKATGFQGDDIRLLQKAFDAEFEAERAERMKNRAEAMARKRAEEEQLKLQRFLERQRREEEDAVAGDAQVAFWLHLIQNNMTPTSMTWRVNPVAVRALVRSLGSNTSLRSLDLCSCKLQDDVGVELGRALATNKTLQRIDLDYNLLGPKSLGAIADGLKTNSTLMSLSLERNPLSGEASNNFEGIHNFAGVLRLNTSLVNLNMFHCGLKKEGGNAIINALRDNRSLICLQLSSTDEIDTADLSAITDILRENARLAEAAAAEEKAKRAAERKAAAERKKIEDELATKAAEEAWVESQQLARARARTEAEQKAADDARKIELEREIEYKEMRARWKAEAEAKEKKKAGDGKKKKK